MKHNRKTTEHENITYTVTLMSRGYISFTHEGGKLECKDDTRFYKVNIRVNDEKNKYYTNHFIVLEFDKHLSHYERKEKAMEIVKHYIELPKEISGNNTSSKCFHDSCRMINNKTANRESFFAWRKALKIGKKK